MIYPRHMRVLLMMVLAAAVAGCTKDKGLHEEPGDLVEMNLTLPGLTVADAKAGGNPAQYADDDIARVRIFAFDAVTGTAAVNEFQDNPQNPFSFSIPSGTYNFYLVVNEPNSGVWAAPEYSALRTVSSLTQLQTVHIESDKLATGGLFVMLASQNAVVVKPDLLVDRYKAVVDYIPVGGPPVTGSSQLEMKASRLAAKVNLKLLRKDALHNYTVAVPTGDVTEAKITGLPTTVPLLPGIESNTATTTEVTLTAEDNIETDPNTPGGATYAGHTAIIPSYHFTDAANVDKAARLVVQMNDEFRPQQMAIGHVLATSAGDPNADYTLHRNTIYHVTGKLGNVLDLNIAVREWDDRSLNIPVGVSSTEIGQAGCDNNLSANGETFTVTFTLPNLVTPVTKGRIRFDITTPTINKDTIKTFDIPAPTAADFKSHVKITTPTPTVFGLDKLYADNKPIVMEVELDGEWVTVKRGTLWPPEGESDLIYPSDYAFGRVDKFGKKYDGSLAQACSDYYTVHEKHPRSGKGKWGVPGFNDWNVDAGLMAPMWYYASKNLPIGGNPVFGDALVRTSDYATSSTWSHNLIPTAMYPASGDNTEWKNPTEEQFNSNIWNFRAFDGNDRVRTRCWRLRNPPTP